jgi:thioredoxin reductase
LTDRASFPRMAIDTPAKIAILGAGPIGLEAALYARFLGYEVVVFEAGEVAASVRRWRHVRMFTPFGLNRSPLGLAAIQAQDENDRPPADDELLTGHQWVDRYLLPLSQTDLLADHLRLRTSVVRIGKEGLLKGDLPGHSDRGDFAFRLLVRDHEGKERIELADAVIDSTGVFRGSANPLGNGGIFAIGEIAWCDRIEYRLPDFAGEGRNQYACKHTLLIGGGYSAATNAVALAQLAQEVPGTRVTWITRREASAAAKGPIDPVANDRLTERAELTRQANVLASDPSSSVTYWPVTAVEKIEGKVHSATEYEFTVELSGQHAGTFQFDRIIANVGFRPDVDLYKELQVQECYATQGQQALLNPEPNFYILGAKSYGRKSNFLLSIGLEQIRDIFKIIGDRPTLDLYAGAHKLLR